jgi:dienelactone hydrolase
MNRLESTRKVPSPAKLRVVLALALLSNFADAQITTKKQVAAWRKQIKEALFIPDPLPKLKTESYGTFNPTPEVTAERISYSTEYGVRVPAIIYHPTATTKTKLPAMVLVNGHGADKSSWYSYYTAILYARLGAVVLTYDPIGAGESNDDRKAGAGEHDTKILDPPSMPARMGGRMITDVMQGVSYLSHRHDVDPHRIAVLGFSMGSFTSVLAGAVDPRIHALLLTGGGDIDGPDGYWDRSAIMCQGGPYRALSFLGARAEVLYTLNAQRGETFIINGTSDTVVDIPHHEQDFFDALRVRVLALNGSANGVFTTYFDLGASHRPNWMTLTAGDWLNKSLHFPNWPPQPPPTESMRLWADRVGYTLNASAAREDRDAGLQILTANVPLLTQDQLSILSPTIWQQRKAEFIYSTWVTRALADAKSKPSTTPPPSPKPPASVISMAPAKAVNLGEADRIRGVFDNR